MMKIKKSSTPGDGRPLSRKPRADSERNREMLVKVAKEAFTANGAGTSLDEIAKKAGVGAGTLYRHFPSREALLEAVYQAEVDKLAEAAQQFAREMEPIDALRAWLLLFVDHLATKKIIAAALSGLVVEQSMSKVHRAVTSIFERAIESGDIRADVNPTDHLRALVGVTFFGSAENWRESASRLVEILIQGSRP